MGLHAIGFLGNTTQEAADDFYPGYAHTFTRSAGNEAGPRRRGLNFDALRGPTGALLIGDAETVARKVLYVNEVLGGLSRITFQMWVSALPHDKMLRSIELLGTRVATIIGQELRALDRSPGNFDASRPADDFMQTTIARELFLRSLLAIPSHTYMSGS